ncbi:MAG: transcriptional regulator [Desulfurococcaceae archaeon]
MINDSFEEIYIDLSNIPFKPLGKKEIQQLEMALIIGTLYRPEIIELIRDPIERSTWVDSLAVAAAALARSKAGLSIPQIAEELGRSEATIRGHLNQKTKAGKLVAETYEKLKKGELKLFFPFIKAPQVSVDERLRALKIEISKLREINRDLEEKLKQMNAINENLVKELSERDNRIKELESKVDELLKEKSELERKYNDVAKTLEKIKTGLIEILRILEQVISTNVAT